MGAGSGEKRDSKMFLSQFQIEKLEYYFNFFDADGNGKLELRDLEFIKKRILDFTGWTENSQQALKSAEVHEAFFEVLFKRVEGDSAEPKQEVTLTEWMNMWEKLLPCTMGMQNFPVWMRLLPETLFRMIDRNGDNEIDEDELAHFYEKMCDVEPDEAKTQAKKAIDQMTDNGNYPLDATSYEQIFANFLIGRTPFGPGRFIFACFSHKDPQFQLIAPVVEEAKPASRARRGSKGVEIPRIKRQALQ
ncbi:sarcoplasmic calcium-binding proteins I, III, and IV-like isoform X2 [Haliotis asinina]|uniref:sarcoplasmic calcium-binding proteins I, III, and IV-like isoform X2 n=1 Tax=Haliotis asinina TaxID=109174 RepID=UPI00353205BF